MGSFDAAGEQDAQRRCRDRVRLSEARLTGAHRLRGYVRQPSALRPIRLTDVTQNRDKLSMRMAFPAKIFLSAVRNISG
jgi:hypothetical protein